MDRKFVKTESSMVDVKSYVRTLVLKQHLHGTHAILNIAPGEPTVQLSTIVCMSKMSGRLTISQRELAISLLGFSGYIDLSFLRGKEFILTRCALYRFSCSFQSQLGGYFAKGVRFACQSPCFPLSFIIALTTGRQLQFR